MNDLLPAHSSAAPRVHRLSQFGLTTPDLSRLARFFIAAFDCRETAHSRRSGREFERLMGVRGGATAATLRLGDATIEILEFDLPGSPYPPNLSPLDNSFQHFALAVNDMTAAFARLSSIRGWSAISCGGPQRLPPSSGGVEAFKFRDPDGHPLELLSFPRGREPGHWRAQPSGRLFLGIDHSAVSCSDAAASVDFYRRIGLDVASRSFNQGIEQERLDGILAPQLDVIALAPATPTPHVELLCYRNRGAGRTVALRSNDVGATRLIFQRAAGSARHAADALIFDPDGHHLLVRANDS